ncbi:MAG: hypothetical protein WCO26_23810 [Deltaproteobacteria bacterium]
MKGEDFGEVEIEGVREVPDENALLLAEVGDCGSLIVKRFHGQRDDHLIDHVVPEKGREPFEVRGQLKSNLRRNIMFLILPEAER